VLACCIVALSGCVEKKDRIVTEQDNGKTFTVAKGESLAVELYGNPTTGYSWEPGGIDTDILKQLPGTRYKSDSKLVGSGGMYTYLFEGASPGRSAVRFVYRRPWEKKEKPARTFDLTVIVE
jgi:predicted secreted protein